VATSRKGIRTPPHVPNQTLRNMVGVMAAGGFEHQKIAQALGISRTTMWKYYRAEITEGAAKVDANVVLKLYQDATGNDRKVGVTAAKWWTQSRMGWTEKHEHTGAGGAPLNPATSYIVRMPTPVESVKEWMDAYVPAEERDG
jgi:hypothetical protein